MEVGDIPDPHEPLRTIFRVFIVVVTIACAGAAFATAVLFVIHRRAVIWRITSLVVFINEDEDFDVLNADGNMTLTNNIVYVAVATTGAFCVCSVCGCVGAAFQKKTIITLYSITIGISAAALALFIIFAIANEESVKKKVDSFGNVTLENGYTDKADGPDDVKPGAFVTYMWQWMQVKFRCCGWQSADDYTRAAAWNRSVKVFNLSRFDPVRANKMLLLPNRVVLYTNVQADRAESGKLELVALKQILPPTCCMLDESDPKNSDAKSASLPKSFLKLVLADYTCPHTGESSFADQGCYNAFLTRFNKNIYAIGGGSAAAVVLLVVTIFFSHQLSNYPTSEEWKEETYRENIALSNQYDPLAINQSAQGTEFWDLTSPEQQRANNVGNDQSHYTTSSKRSPKHKKKKKRRLPFGLKARR